MSANYNPDKDAEPDPRWFTVYLSNRDISGQVPIDFVTHPGISVTPACFADGTYDIALAEKCISNLLASQFRRFILDLYWDSGLRRFNLCPVAIPQSVNNGTSTFLVETFATDVPLLSTALSNISTDSATALTLSQNSKSKETSNTTAQATSTTSALGTSVTGPFGEVLLQLGQYKCSESLNIGWVASLILDYIQTTNDNVQPKLLFLEFNLHAAAQSRTPGEPAHAPRGHDLPQASELAGAQLSNISSYIYPPNLLYMERSNLNRSWFDIDQSKDPLNKHPILEYFKTTTLPNGDLATSDGWPNEDYILIYKGRRVLLNWGRIDPQMETYDFTGDSGTIFSAVDVVKPRFIEANGAGDLLSGCFFNSAETNVSQLNSSWAMTTQDQNLPSLINNLTTCGISPLLNNTLAKSMANKDITPYSTYAQAAVWNWASGEPRNTSAPGVDDDRPKAQFRCALLDISSAYRGHWRVDDCSKNYPVACRMNNQPYVWQLSSRKVPFDSGPTACQKNGSFEAPRTGLENAYLYHKVLSDLQPTDHSGSMPTGVWVNLNSLDVESCWVTSGPTGTCTYYEDSQAVQQRTVLVPTIGAIIVLILTALTLFVKCNSNRRNSRARRRGEGGWEYEGVPS